MKVFGRRIQIADPTDKFLVDNDISLTQRVVAYSPGLTLIFLACKNNKE